jgi:DNA-binding NarL/FixJ family response regulator
LLTTSSSRNAGEAFPMNYAFSNPTPMVSAKLPRVILADDQPMYLAEMVELLRGAGYDCECVSDGQRCEQELLRGDVDVLVADIRMPGNMNLELASRVQAMANPPAVILMTGFPTLETAISSVKLKISAYLVKPFGFNELLGEVQQALNARRSSGSSPPGPRRGSDRPKDPGMPVPHAVEGLMRNPDAQRLTRREFEVLVRVLMGDDVPAIGAVLFISPHTVRNHLKAIYRKLDVRSRVELVVRFGPIQRAAPHSLS